MNRRYSTDDLAVHIVSIERPSSCDTYMTFIQVTIYSFHLMFKAVLLMIDIMSNCPPLQQIL